MRRLTIIVATTETVRFEAALEIAAATAALDQPVGMFFRGESVALLASTHPLLAEAIALGVAITACQTGLAETRIAADTLPEGVEVGGLVGLLADAGDDRMLLA